MRLSNTSEQMFVHPHKERKQLHQSPTRPTIVLTGHTYKGLGKGDFQENGQLEGSHIPGKAMPAWVLTQ